MGAFDSAMYVPMIARHGVHFIGSEQASRYKYDMRNLIDIITESETLRESLTADKLEAFITHQLETNATYVVHLRNTPGDDAIKSVKAACVAAHVQPKVVALGHNMVGKELPNNLFHGGLVILGITGNLAMCLKEAGMRSLREQLVNAAHATYPTSIIVIEPGRHESALGPEVASRFPEVEYEGGAGRTIDDGGIHRVV